MLVLVQGGTGFRRCHRVIVHKIPLGNDPNGAIRVLEPTGESRDLSGQAVFGFAGIGRPAKFRATLEKLGCAVAGWRAFPDHHRYRRAEIEAILRDAAAAGAIAVTT